MLATCMSQKELKYIPEGTIRLNILGYYDIKKGEIPDTVTKLLFNGNYYSDKIKYDIYIPNSVTHLSFNDAIDHNKNISLENICIPDSVTHITLGKTFYHVLKHKKLPNSVTHLTINVIFDKRTRAWLYESKIEDGWLPNHITHLSINGKLGNTSKSKLLVPNSVTFMKFGNLVGECMNMDEIVFPPSLQKIVIPFYFEGSLSQLLNIDIIVIPVGRNNQDSDLWIKHKKKVWFGNLKFTVEDRNDNDIDNVVECYRKKYKIFRIINNNDKI